MKKITIFTLLCATVVTLNSCLGASADISIRANGSGKIALEYRVSEMLESMGRLDGNEHWPTIPVGKTDFERSLTRIPGLRLLSFSSKNVRNANGGADLVTKVVLEFKDTAALLAFLDSSGSHASLVEDNGKNILRLVLLEPSAAVDDSDLLALLKEISAGYEISISLSAPKNASLALIPSSVSAARALTKGKKASFSMGIGELLSLENGLSLEITW